MRLSPIVSLVGLLHLLVATPPASADRPLDDYAGSFELETGEVITGGPFVERFGDPVRFLYLDTENLDKSALFERESELVLRSVRPPGTITLRFEPTPEGEIDQVVWSDSEGPVRGWRVAPHDTRELSIGSADGTELTARLLVPRCPGPRPLAVLVGGSGPTTRWAGTFETFFAKLGMAALIYDKRGAGDPDWSEPDLVELAQDAEAALRAGASAPRIDAGRAGLWGSSQGGWVAPMAAVETDPAFLVVRAGPGVSEMETHLHELRQEVRAEGLSGIDLDHATALRREIYELAVAGAALSATDRLVAPYLDQEWYQTAFGEGPVSGLWSERWWSWAGRNFEVEPGPYLERLDVPILWFLAEDDENVPFVASHSALREAFAASPGDDETVVVFPDAKHAFLVETPDGGFRYADGYFERVRSWLAERGFSDEGCWARNGAVSESR